MSRNGSGTYSLAAGNPVVTGATISSTTHNNTMTDIETALTDSLTANGEKVWAGTQDANGQALQDTGTLNPNVDGGSDLGTTSKRYGNVFADAIGDSGQVLTNNALYHIIPLQPAFLGINASTISNVTGNSTVYTYVADTEVYDQGGDYDLTTFTAPVTGKYLLIFNVHFAQVTAAADTILLSILTSNDDFFYSDAYTNGFGTSPAKQLSIIADMDAADTAVAKVRVEGEASDVVDLQGSATTTFSGCLLA